MQCVGRHHLKIPEQRVGAGHLAGKDYLALGRLTIADIAYAPIMKRCLDFKIGRKSMPNLERWMAGIAGRSSFKAATA